MMPVQSVSACEVAASAHGSLVLNELGHFLVLLSILVRQ